MKLAGALARAEGRQLYSETQADAEGRRSVVRAVGAIDDDVRAMALGFTSGEKARFIASAENPPAILLAVSGDLGVHAGNELKPLLVDAGGRGGGNAILAQGSVPDAGKLAAVIAKLS